MLTLEKDDIREPQAELCQPARPLDPWPTLRSLVAGPINIRAIKEHWDELLRLAASIRAGTVSAFAMLKKLAGYPRQNPVARALREVGGVGRILFMLEWLDDPE